MANTLRPNSSQSQRPHSSLSLRAPSRTSSRPLSRISGRTYLSRYAAKTIHLARVLVSNVTKMDMDDDPNEFPLLYEKTLRALETKQMFTETMESTEARIRRVSRKARINMQDNLGEALLQSWDLLKASASNDFEEDEEIRLSNLPELMQFLLELSSAPLPSTLVHADIILSGERELSKKEKKLTWTKILEEEPLEGEHWEGIFDSIRLTYDDDGDSLSSWGSDNEDGNLLSDVEPDDASPNGLKLSHSALEEYLPVVKSDLFNHFPNPAYTNREIVEAIQQKQSWRPEWDPKILWNRPFNVADPSTLGAMADSVSFSSKLSIRTTTPRFIDEVDAVRNALLILQGIDSPLFAFLNDDHDEPTQASIHPEAPRVLHLSAEAYRSILTELCFVATRLQELRYFASSVFALSATKLLRTSRMRSRYFCRTLEAFAEGVHKYIIDIEKWCAERDEAIVQARNGVGRQIVVTLLSLHYDVKSKATATLELLQDILRRLLRSESHHLGDTHHQKDVEMIGFLRAIDFGPIAPHRLSTRLLDFIQDSIDTQLAIGDYHAASKLSELFVATAEPLWKSVGKWMSNGITISLGQGEDEDYFDSLDKELFIRRRSTDFIDPEFWERGYILHTEVESDDDEDEDEEEEKELKQSQITFLVPRIFMAIAEDVLRVGKAVGLLRAIGIEPFHDQEKLSEMRNWCSFSELYQRCETIASISPSTESTEDVPTPYSDQILHLRIVFDTLPSYLLTYLQPWCLAGQGKLNTLLFDDCAMMEHLNSIEGLYFMRRGDAMGIFCDKVFAKLDAHQKWHDLHFLNSVLRDVSAVDRKSWIDFTLVQFTVRGGRQRSNTSTVQCFEGFTADYAVSFPLTYLLRRPSASVYPSIFVLLLQIRRVKVAVEGIALKGVIRPTATEDTADVNSFYALRGKFAWAINCLMNFLATHVIDSHLRRFHGRIKDAQSLDEMIDAHDHYLAQLQMLCFLHSKTTALHRALMSILDLSLHFVQCLEAYMTEQSSSFADQRNVNYAHDEKRKRRRRHQRKARQAGRNVIGFSDVLKPISSDSSSSSDEEVYLEETKDNDDKRAMRRPSLSASISFADASFALKMDRISEELDGLVRYIRKAVDVLAGGTSEAASTFGIFSFMLEDWDM